jgi:hypothetical protein
VHDHLKETNQAITEIEAMGLAKVRNTAARVSIQHLEKLGYMKPSAADNTLVTADLMQMQAGG